ncbi:hypothetical protein PMIN01_12066 [Paraphaeosphaeria minitans]|uniref:Uncharacterized protein n=1 Tax=Paraphaeosphaeria minitans TaxID=565426 RepID=A0A9P6KK59_9PLEO|nr:hypothetical protein PMIN01_12066 [Paraphaeosphaeria minitans]
MTVGHHAVALSETLKERDFTDRNRMINVGAMSATRSADNALLCYRGLLMTMVLPMVDCADDTTATDSGDAANTMYVDQLNIDNTDAADVADEHRVETGDFENTIYL